MQFLEEPMVETEHEEPMIDAEKEEPMVGDDDAKRFGEILLKSVQDLLR